MSTAIDSIILVRPYAAEKKELPLGLLYVGTAMKRKGYKVTLIDLQDTPERENEIVEILKKSPQTMLGISAIAPHYHWVKTFSIRVKNESPHTKIIVGGHITITYNVLLTHSPIDYVCIGEGEETLPELIETLNSQKPIDAVNGIAYKNLEGGVVKTAWRTLLSEFLMPDYSLIDINHYLIHPTQDYFFRRSQEYKHRMRDDDKLAVVMFSRGCIGSCGFCYRHLPGFRQGSIEWTWNYITLLYEKFGIRYFRIDDELFTNNREWFEALYEKLKSSKLDILFRITGLRVDTIDDDLLAKLKEIGCIAINYGIESCSQTILDAMHKRVTVQQNIDAVKKTLMYKMQTMTYIIWGYTGEDKITVSETIDVLLDLNLPPELVSIFYLTALPGTQVYREAVAKGQIADEDEYLDSLYPLMTSREGIHKKYLINFSQLTRDELSLYEEELIFLLKIQRKIGKRPKLIRMLRMFIEGLPTPVVLIFFSLIKKSIQAFHISIGITKKSAIKIYNALIKIRIYFTQRVVTTLHAKNQQSLSQQLEMTRHWLNVAQDSTKTGGVSRGYSLLWDRKFNKRGWQPPYPETTGYLIPTYLNAFTVTNDNNYLDRALAMADWELTLVRPDGAINGGHLSVKNNTPALFDTGAVLRGLLAAYKSTNANKYLESAKKMAAWMLHNEHNAGGYWTSVNASSVNDQTTTYNVFASVPLLEFAQITGENRYRDLAIRVAHHTMNQQHPNGWFDNTDFNARPDPLLHTIAYTIDGLWDIGVMTNTQEFMDSARKAMDGVLTKMDRSGYIPGRLNKSWTGTVPSACLTGIAQISTTCFKMFKTTQDHKYLKAARLALDYVGQHQNALIESFGGGIGAVWGSWPIHGDYQPYQALNWAAKFFADALLEALQLEKNQRE